MEFDYVISSLCWHERASMKHQTKLNQCPRDPDNMIQVTFLSPVGLFS